MRCWQSKSGSSLGGAQCMEAQMVNSVGYFGILLSPSAAVEIKDPDGRRELKEKLKPRGWQWMKAAMGLAAAEDEEVLPIVIIKCCAGSMEEGYPIFQDGDRYFTLTGEQMAQDDEEDGEGFEAAITALQSSSQLQIPHDSIRATRFVYRAMREIRLWKDVEVHRDGLNNLFISGQPPNSKLSKLLIPMPVSQEVTVSSFAERIANAQKTFALANRNSAKGDGDEIGGDDKDKDVILCVVSFDGTLLSYHLF
ncbi:hypothetical protein BC829DRAFT_437391 [Chytridium lagenaria]|nr:hypothetical protein BC829DRAFT_437391 [Chytridium lagenaria]